MRNLLDLPEDLIRPEWRECAVPGRPWWSRRTWGDASLYRRGGDHLPTADSGYTVKPPTNGDAEAYDAAHPLPHPGYRVGQIWALLYTFGGGFHVYMVQNRHDATVAAWVHGRPKVEAAFLLHDPLRPDLAPWSSAARDTAEAPPTTPPV